jgi:hypothetical protein
MAEHCGEAHSGGTGNLKAAMHASCEPAFEDAVGERLEIASSSASEIGKLAAPCGFSR